MLIYYFEILFAWFIYTEANLFLITFLIYGMYLLANLNVGMTKTDIMLLLNEVSHF